MPAETARLAGQGALRYLSGVTAASPLRMSLPTHLSLPGGKVPLLVRVNPRARRLALRIDAQSDAVELVLPPMTSLPQAAGFLESNRGWVASRLKALPPRASFVNGAEIPVHGFPHRIRQQTRGNSDRPVWIEGGEIRVTGDPEHLARRVRDFLHELARKELAQRARKLASTIGRKVEGVSVRDTTTRWGSCSASGNLSFSWRLILAPQSVLHYVVAHEVAHLAEMNHGARFWRLVERLDPDHERARAWLNDNRARLLRIG
ncbi:MAG TPA: SprT family zinc-dependent metalloprotease [Stellaceae bacterium]|nr:SprT family zinc-dependent metalloprotease [Stellaceae bacterium]